MQIIAPDGSYNLTQFEGKNGIWRLVGVNINGIDTFKSNAGEFKEIKRSLIPILQRNNEIWPVEIKS